MAERGDKGRRNYVDDPDKVIRIAREGLEKHRKKGNVVTFEGKMAGSSDRPGLNREQRKLFQNLCDVAIMELCERNFDAWADCIEAIWQFGKDVGWKYQTIMATMKTIEDLAISTTQDPYLGKAAREFLSMRRKRIISLPKAVRKGLN